MSLARFSKEEAPRCRRSNRRSREKAYCTTTVKYMWIQLQQSKVVCCWTFSSSSPNPKAAFGFKAVNGFHKLYIAVEAALLLRTKSRIASMAQQIALAIQRYKIGFLLAVRHADKKRIHQYFIFSLRVHKSFVG